MADDNKLPNYLKKGFWSLVIAGAVGFTGWVGLSSVMVQAQEGRLCKVEEQIGKQWENSSDLRKSVSQVSERTARTEEKVDGLSDKIDILIGLIKDRNK